MANAVVSWDQRPEYLAYTDWTPIPGITSYPVPRRGTGTDVTQFHPGQAFLSEHNLPDIIYQLYPCAEWKRFKETPLPQEKRNPDGSLVYEQYTKPGHQRQALLDFKILPDKISTQEGWWYHEFVRRMDPRIRQRDIIMREEATGQRMRTSDQRYINLHLNTPGYRIYRPVWKMISWHVKEGDDKQSQRKQLVLNSLTDAQKRANTTRGSTPGLINPALDDVPGNRVDLQPLGARKRGPRHAAVDTDNDSTTQAPQISQMPQAQQLLQVTQMHQTAQSSQAPPVIQSQQLSQASRASDNNVAAAPSSHAPATMAAESHSIFSTPAVQAQHDTRGYVDTQARDAAAMPPPPRPVISRINQSLRPQVFGSHQQPPHSTNRPSEFDDTPADFEEVNELRETNLCVPELGDPCLINEEMAEMSAKSDKAMAEIYRMCEPFLDPCAGFQDSAPMELSAELIDDLGIGFLFPKHAGRQMRERRNQSAMPNPARTMQAGDMAQLVPRKQGTKRQEFLEDDGNFRRVQLDVERQERRPVKRVKSVHGVNSQGSDRKAHQETAHNSQQQLGNYHPGYSRGWTFGGPTMHYAQPSQHALVEDVDPHNDVKSRMGE